MSLLDPEVTVCSSRCSFVHVIVSPILTFNGFGLNDLAFFIPIIFPLTSSFPAKAFDPPLSSYWLFECGVVLEVKPELLPANTYCDLFVVVVVLGEISVVKIVIIIKDEMSIIFPFDFMSMSISISHYHSLIEYLHFR